jgi:hypothetical protein
MPLVSDFIRFENNGGLDADGVTVGGLMFDDAKGWRDMGFIEFNACWCEADCEKEGFEVVTVIAGAGGRTSAKFVGAENETEDEVWDNDGGWMPDIDAGRLPDIVDGCMPNICGGWLPGIVDGCMPGIVDGCMPDICGGWLPGIVDGCMPDICGGWLPGIVDCGTYAG